MLVACVLKTGGIYNATWVARLKRGVENYLTAEHKFVCLSDVDVPCERIPLEQNWPHWWSKLELFKLSGPLLYFDLDTLIIGDLTDIAKQATEWKFTALRDFHREKSLGSGVMAWNISMKKLYEDFALSPDKLRHEYRGRGDQHFIEDRVKSWDRWQDKLPGQIVSYKVDHCEQEPPPNARVVCLHGSPKFNDMPVNSWARMMWEAA